MPDKGQLHKVLDRVYRFPHNVNLYDLLREIYGRDPDTNTGYLREKEKLIDRKGFTWWWNELDLANQQKVCALMEKRYGPLQGWLKAETDPRAMDMLGMFAEINRDCSRTGESVVPLTDTAYYAEQIHNIYETLSEAESMSLAEEMAELSKWVNP